MATLPDHFVKKVEAALEATKAIPLWGYPPPFPLDEVSIHLKEALKVEDLKILTQHMRFLEDIFAGLGNAPIQISLELIPLQTAFHFLIPQEEVSRLTSALLHNKRFSDPRFQEGFYKYLCLEALQVIDRLNAFEDLTLSMKETTPLPEGALCMDITIQIDKESFWGRLVFTEQFLSEFKSHFALKRQPLLSNPLAKHLDITLHLQMGKTVMPLSEWKEVKVGDFILLDHCSFDIKAQKGHLDIVLGKIPIFKAKLKHGSIKILEYAFYYEEEGAVMEEETPKESEVEADFDKLISTREIPITLTVEVGRLNINLEKLLELKPGNTLELKAGADVGVDLTLNGKRIAKGELLQLGDLLGVRILELNT